MRWPPSNRKDAAHIEIPSECLEGDTRTVSFLESAQCEQPASLQVGPTRSLCRQWADAAGMTVQRSADVPRNWRSHRVRRRFRPLPSSSSVRVTGPSGYVTLPKARRKPTADHPLRDGVGLFATFAGLPFAEYICWDHASEAVQC
jgi:hypothetical protein